MGAWIEILGRVQEVVVELVAPLVGAWIEIPGRTAVRISIVVAPLVGVWIKKDKKSIRNVLYFLVSIK